MPAPARLSSVIAPYLGFAAFGAFWGTWGAAIPALRAQAGIDDGQLGTALLFVGVGALPAMLLAGRAVDRFGNRAVAVSMAALGIVGLVLAGTARDQLTLSLALTALGVASGASDVAINAAASSAQVASGGPVVSRSHGIFSVAVVVFSLGTGGALWLGAPLVLPFAVVAALAAAAALRVATGDAPAPGAGPGATEHANEPVRAAVVGFGSLVVVGALSALAFATENAHQSWSALYLGDVLDAGPALAATGPAIFATVVAIVRFSTARLGVAHPILTVAVGALAATGGTLMLAGSSTILAGLAGLAVAGAGTAVLYPTLVSALSARVPATSRGRAISLVATIAYTGFLAGPVYVGLWSDARGLHTAMVAVGFLAAVLAAVGPPALRAILGPEREVLDRTEPTKDHLETR